VNITNIERKTAEHISSIALKAFSSAAKSLKTSRMTFTDYVKSAWHIVEPSNRFIPNWHIDCIAEHLEAVTLGQIKNLVINLPPRELKSTLVTKLWPTWSWTEKPWLEFLFFSYSQDLSEMFSKDRRDIVESDWYQRQWGSLVKIAEDQNQKKEFMNLARGRMVATSIGGRATGKGAHIIVIDDGINPTQAQSRAERESAIRYVKNTVSTRLNDKKTGAIVEVSQRTDKMDISGVLLAEGTYTHLNLQAIADKKTVITFPITKRQIVREIGHVLHPEREDRATLELQKGRMQIPGSNSNRSWQAQYQGDPSSDEGALFRRTDWQFYSVEPQVQFWCWSWDTAMEDGEDNDWTVGILLGFHGAGVIVPRVFRARLQYPDAKAAIINQWAIHPSHALLIEDKVSGKSLQQDLKRSTDYPIIPVKVHGDKRVRASLASQYVAAKRIALLDGAFWVPEFIEEFAEFTGENSGYKDQVDAFSQAINHRYLNYQKPSMAMIGNGVMVAEVNGNGHKNGNGFTRSHADWM
jgi:predicted phage terminase large subunit-like protein